MVNKEAFWDYRRNKDQITIDIATKIIQKRVSNNLFNNIIKKKDLKVIREKVKTICS